MVTWIIALIIALFPQHTIQEDDPGWDCATMGNKVCGCQIYYESPRR